MVTKNLWRWNRLTKQWDCIFTGDGNEVLRFRRKTAGIMVICLPGQGPMDGPLPKKDVVKGIVAALHG